ncbi:Putative universal stress protein SAV1710 [Achromobacter spanius]|jgi:nucleotide-binding universal stress UspA family protein|uniref:universal stress protein n=1 Tax=Achromobacter TaxID=222 RepID=UPI000C2C661E|nr:universal stress protein [Achromobacter spanius]AUA57837.1 universal stress protein [Achromobacter spanius]CAB3626564.1 Putative universal stress protein [Achromobacter spanius]SPT37216.1 Putative universal stress protein SAV1710 [Achromobacter denitrificans]VEE60122.1 Putative universal stress protein SAV1710 [Achromobacter spanius]
MYKRILVPIDGSPTAEAGLKEAIRMAQLMQASLRMIHVVDELSFALTVDAYSYHAGELLDLTRKNGAKLLETAVNTARAAGVEADSVLYENLDRTVHQRVMDEADDWKADLIVLGTHGRRGVRRAVLGSSAETIMRGAAVPVLLVRAPEA